MSSCSSRCRATRCKPASFVLTKPRTMVKRGDYYGPEPRKLASYKPEADSYRPAADEQAGPARLYDHS